MPFYLSHFILQSISFKKDFAGILSVGEKFKIRQNGRETIDDILEFYGEHGLAKTLSKIPLINPNKIDLYSFELFLHKALDDDPSLLSIENIGNPSRSQFKKCISIYDWLKYSKRAGEKLKSLGCEF